MSENETVVSAEANVYAALGTPDPEGMLVKAQLATRIGQAIRRKGMTQVKASTIIDMPEAKLSKMLRGQFRGVSERKMMDCLIALGENVIIDVKPAPAGEPARLSVRMKAHGRMPRAARPTASKPKVLRQTA